MRRIPFFAAAVCALGTAQARADVFTVLVKSNLYTFVPGDITIQAGDGIVWDWVDSAVPHSSSSDGNVWDSGIHIGPFRFRRPFLDAGDYPYYCVLHGAPGGVGMSGIIHVVP
jgi:plastocyanin